MRDLSRERRIRQGATLIGAAGLFALAFAALDLEFWWIPLGVGLVYLAAAAACGREGSYWATAATVTGWGLSVAWVNAADPDVIVSAAQVFGIGVGALASALLARRGFAVDLLGVAATATAIGLLFMLQPQAGLLADWQTYAVALAVLGAANLALAYGGGRTRSAHGAARAGGARD